MGVVLMPIIQYILVLIPLLWLTLATMIVFVALLTPIASPHVALLHGNKEWIMSKDVYFYGALMTIWSVLIAFVVA